MTAVSRRRLFAGTGALAATAAGTTALASAAAAQEPTAPAAGTGDPVFGQRIDMHCHFVPPRYRASLMTHGYALVGGVPLPQ